LISFRLLWRQSKPRINFPIIFLQQIHVNLGKDR
jgi:hypothetical protein